MICEECTDSELYPAGGPHSLSFNYCSTRSLTAYCITVEIELFTDPDFVKYGVARTVLDMLLHVLDSHYLSRRGYEFASNSTDYTTGGRRSVACILLNVPHSKEDESLAWKIKWLEQFGFKETGTQKGVGRKLNQTIDLSLYKRDTNLTISSWAP